MSEAVDIYLFDTSAWLTLIEDEQGADTVQNLLVQAGQGTVLVLTSFKSFMEVYYISLQEGGEAVAQERLRLMSILPVTRVESNDQSGLLAAEFKAQHRLSVADAWIAGLAQERGAILVHKDPEFEQVESGVKVLKLPYK
ncbi:MAG: PIN domain-containing protein [Herpetosiphonaceae bacterium]|nr:PIN domain-containing protein [Herpetosiphonaceae bacterium]